MLNCMLKCTTFFLSLICVGSYYNKMSLKGSTFITHLKPFLLANSMTLAIFIGQSYAYFEINFYTEVENKNHVRFIGKI